MCKVGFNFWLSFNLRCSFWFLVVIIKKIKIANNKLHWGISLLLITNNIFLLLTFFFVSIPFGGDFCFWDQYCQLEKCIFGPWIRDCNRTEHAFKHASWRDQKRSMSISVSKRPKNHLDFCFSHQPKIKSERIRIAVSQREICFLFVSKRW